MNKNKPRWLPDPLALEPWNIDTYTQIYIIFCRDFKDINKKVYFKNERIIIFNRLLDGKEEVFWHITDKESHPYSERYPDIRRAERINWIKPIIENYADPEIKCFDYLEGNGKTRTYIWLEKFDFVVILEKLPKGNYTIITAFYIDYENKRRELRKKFDISIIKSSK